MRLRTVTSLVLAIASAGAVLLSVRAAQATHPGQNGRIAFVEGQTNGAPEGTLKSIEPDGSDLRTLTTKPVRRPAWSPDGTRLAYDLRDAQATRIYLVDPDGSNEQHVTTGEGASWSPDGTKLVFKKPDCTLWIRDLGARTETQLTHLDPGAQQCHTDPAWQPGGDRIVFTKIDVSPPLSLNGDLWSIRADGSGATQLTFLNVPPGSGAAQAPTWSPDGTKIAFGRYVYDYPRSAQGIWVIPANGGTPTRLAYSAIKDDTTSSVAKPHAAWSPDGKAIAHPYTYWNPYPSLYFDLLVMGAGGGAGTPIHTAAPNAPISDVDWQPLGGLVLGPARLVIRNWRGEAEHEFTRNPPVVTLYGKTVVPVHMRTGTPGEPVVFRAEPQGAAAGAGAFGFSTDPGTVGPAEYATTLGADGKIDLYFVVRNLYAETVEGEPVPTAFRLTATAGAAIPREARIDVVDNRDRVLSRYSVAQDYVPDGVRSIWRDAFLPPLRGPIADLPGGLLGAVVQPGNIATGSIHCNTYQSRTLVFLHDLRHSDDGWLLNGLDYAPLQTTHTEHHFVALYPSDEQWAFPRTRIFDPWMPQTIAVYTWQEFVNFVDTIGQGSHVVPDMQRDAKNPGTCTLQCGAGVYVTPPYPALGGRYAYFPENATRPKPLRYDGCLAIPRDWCVRNGYAASTHRDAPDVTDHATVVIGSPVRFYVEQPDGRGFGWRTPETFVNDFADDFTAAALAYPEPGGAEGWYVEVPPGRAFRFAASAVADGTMSVAILGTGGLVWGVYRDIPVTVGATSRLDVDLDAACTSLPLDSGDDVPCERPPTACSTDATCRDADPCTADGCADGLCTFTQLAGAAGAYCACERPAPAQCAEQGVPSAVIRKTAAACRLLAKATAAAGKKQRRLLGQAGKQWRAADKALKGRQAKRTLSTGCLRALRARVTDGLVRTKNATR